MMQSAWRFGVLMAWVGLLGACSDDDTPGTVPLPDVPSEVSTADTTPVDAGPIQCLANAQCAGLEGVDACHEGRCDRSTGECILWARPDCCTDDSQCDDGDDDTADACDPAFNVCKFTDTMAPCDTDAQCPPGGPCVTVACEGFCSSWKTPGCCLDDAACDDGDGCTTDRCQNQTCTHQPGTDPQCCGQVLTSWAFAADLEGVEIETNDHPARWHYSTARSHSTPGALRFADPETDSYSNPLVDGAIATSFGRALFAPVDLPAGAELTLTFWIYLDLAEKQVEYDQLYLELYTDQSATPVVWDKSGVADDAYETWVQIEVDVSQWAGQTIRFGFVFDTLDGTVNNGEGVFIDDVMVLAGCSDAPGCTSDDQCTDDDPCTVGSCVAGQCEFQSGSCCQVDADCPAPPPVACAEVRCVEGMCVAGTIDGCCVSDDECADDNECTIDRCDAATSSCLHLPSPDCCDPVQCDDGNPCTVDGCDANGCTHDVVPGCGACNDDVDCEDDGNPCTYASCFQGQCLYVPDPECNPCNSDVDCNDGDPCTDEVCNSGQCIPVVIPGCVAPCETGADCVDNDPCTADLCVDGACQHPWITGCQPDCQVNTDCNDDDPCTADFCVEGSCQSLDIPGCGEQCQSDAQCASDQPCVQGLCVGGQCVEQPIEGCCQSAAECNDADPCTADFCEDGQCANLAIPGCGCPATGCNDNNPCTQDACQNGACVFTPVPNCCTADAQCQDDDPCTVSKCGPDNQCLTAPLAGCCKTAAQCNDGNPCTTDTCGAGNTCQHAVKPGCCTTAADCNDGIACTADTCTNGTCGHAPKPGCCTSASQCADGNPCTVDACQNNVCVNTPSTAPGCCATAADCEDGDSCTTHTCNNGVCATKTKPDCCATDVDCEDGLACSKNTCVNGSCQTTQIPGCCFGNASCTDGVACTVDSCNNATGQCQYVVLPGCCTLDSQCDDGNPCTKDTCASNNFCFFEPIEGCCTSDAQCGGAGECQEAACLENQCIVSDVAGCCTSDAQCNDGQPCTQDACVDGACQVSPVAGCCTSAAQCNDGDECTIDGCSNNACTYQENPACGCQDQAVLSQGFNAGLGGWSPQGQGQAKWQVSALQSVSKPSSLWFGNANTGNFGNGQSASAGRVVSPAFSLPADQDALLTFKLWLDIEQAAQFDKFEVRVRPAGQGQGTLVWNKDGVPASAYQSWLDAKVNLSAFAGQSVQVIFQFNSVDAIDNDGQGVFIDDVAVEATCDEVTVCGFDEECNDGNVCTQDQCVAGTCQHTAIEQCCTSNAQCNDNYVCTTDICSPEGECINEPQPGCCQFDAECQDDSACTAASCIDNQCVAQPVDGDGCCVSDADCNDGNACTVGACEDFECAYEVVDGPNCCQPATQLSVNFDNATKQGFTLIGDGSPSKWSVQNKRFFSAPFSLYFGIPGQWVVGNGEQVQGQAVSPSVTVPITAKNATLTFRTWWELEQTPFGSGYRMAVLNGTTLKTHWSADDAPQGVGQWIKVTVDLSEYKGKTVQLYWIAQVGGEPFGAEGEGIYLDSVTVSTTCQ